MRENSSDFDEFHVNLRRLIGETPGMSSRKLSSLLGKSNGSYIGKMLETRSVPAADVFLGICTIFRVSPEVLMGRYLYERPQDITEYAAENNLVALPRDVPEIGEVFHAWRTSAGKAELPSRINPFVEYFDMPDRADMIPRPHKLGNASIASSIFKMACPSDLCAVFEKFNSLAVAQAVSRDHLDAVDFDYTLARDVSMTLNFANGRVVSVTYDRLLMKMDINGVTRIANFSRLKERREILAQTRHASEISEKSMSIVRSG